jgi:hypothetical protein
MYTIGRHEADVDISSLRLSEPEAYANVAMPNLAVYFKV